MKILIFTLALSLTACKRPAQIIVSENNPPIFSFTGNERLAFLLIAGPKVRDAAGKDEYEAWQIEPMRDGLSTKEVSPITYGALPANFKQKLPERGSPPEIQEEAIYWVHAEFFNEKKANKYFVLRQGKIISADNADQLENKK